ncbi:MAG: hypothetical protein K8I60_07925, partial [Anaerolineae bacterium]|nr:hypothetical protein [Anaerolineae bacterium]
DAPLPFDTNIQPKPAYHALSDTLSALVAPPPTTTPPPSVVIPDGPAIVVDVQPASGEPGSQVNVALRMYHVSGVYGLQAECQVDPARLAGINHTDGDGFNGGNGFIVDQGFQSSGQWKVAATRLQPNPAISGDVTAFSFNYSVQSAGETPVTCNVLAVNGMGDTLPVQVVNSQYNSLQPQQNIIIPPPEMPTVEPLPIIPLPTPAPVVLSTITGAAAYQNQPTNGGITVTLLRDGAPLVEVVTHDDGLFSFTDVPTGTYTLLTSAPQHVSTTLTVTVDVDGQTIDVSAGTLPAGDTDNSGTVDIADAAFVGANFGLDGSLVPVSADMNGDQVINIADLALVGANFNVIGPVSAQ